MFIHCWVSRHSAGQGPAIVLAPASELEIAMPARWAEVFGDDVVAAMTDRGQFQPSKTGHFRPLLTRVTRSAQRVCSASASTQIAAGRPTLCPPNGVKRNRAW